MDAWWKIQYIECMHMATISTNIASTQYHYYCFYTSLNMLHVYMYTSWIQCVINMQLYMYTSTLLLVISVSADIYVLYVFIFLLNLRSSQPFVQWCQHYYTDEKGAIILTIKTRVWTITSSATITCYSQCVLSTILSPMCWRWIQSTCM